MQDGRDSNPRFFESQVQQFAFHLSTGQRPVVIVFTALFLSEVTVRRLLHGFLDTHLLIHSWCDIILCDPIQPNPLRD